MKMLSFIFNRIIRTLLLAVAVSFSFSYVAFCAQQEPVDEDLEADSLLDVLESNQKSEQLVEVEQKSVREQLLEDQAKKNQAIAEKSKSYIPEDPNAAYLAGKKQALSEWNSRKRGDRILRGRKDGAAPSLDNNLEVGLMGSFNKVGEKKANKVSDAEEEFVYEAKDEKKKNSGFDSLSNSFKKK